MAMLMLDGIFQLTWGNRGGNPLQQEFWPEIIEQVKQVNPDFTFFAEVYWDMEWELQQQGFDYCYDKRLYDRLLHDSVASIKGHLQAEWGYQSRLVRFVENHDEPRAASAFGIQRSLAAASIALSLPGARLFHHGQERGKQIKIPVELGRIGDEKIIAEIQEFYQKFLPALSDNMHKNGRWRLLHVEGMDFWQSPFISYVWEFEHSTLLVLVNYSDHPQSGRVNLAELGRTPTKICDTIQQQTLPLSNNQTSLEIQTLPWEVKLLSVF